MNLYSLRNSSSYSSDSVLAPQAYVSELAARIPEAGRAAMIVLREDVQIVYQYSFPAPLLGVFFKGNPPGKIMGFAGWNG